MRVIRISSKNSLEENELNNFETHYDEEDTMSGLAVFKCFKEVVRTRGCMRGEYFIHSVEAPNVSEVDFYGSNIAYTDKVSESKYSVDMRSRVFWEELSEFEFKNFKTASFMVYMNLTEPIKYMLELGCASYFEHHNLELCYEAILRNDLPFLKILVSNGFNPFRRKSPHSASAFEFFRSPTDRNGHEECMGYLDSIRKDYE